MSWQTIGLFVAMETMLCLSPGPAVLLVLSQALARGGRASIWSAYGILAGNTFYFFLSATSLGALLLASYDLFFAVKWLGAAYLIWLGAASILGHAEGLAVRPAAGPPQTRRRLLFNGFVLQTANPKALLFFTALLPQFIDPAHAVAPQVAVLAGLSVSIELVVLACYGAAAGRVSRFARQPRFARLANGAAGMLLIGAGVGLAALRRS